MLDLEQQTGAGVVGEGEHLGETGHTDPGEFLTFPASGIERGDLGGVHAGDAAVLTIRVQGAGVGGAIDGRVVHDHELTVGAHVDVGLDHVCALVDAGDERGDRVLRPVGGRTSVCDDQGRDPNAGGIDHGIGDAGAEVAGRVIGGGGGEGDGHFRTPPRRLRVAFGRRIQLLRGGRTMSTRPPRLGGPSKFRMMREWTEHES